MTPWRATSLERIAVLIAVAAVSLPIVVSLVAIATRDYHPSGDVALELLRVGEVGGSRTPLTGAWSRWGWDHPGPLLFWILAPFTWVFAAHGALIGALAVNAAALVGAVLVARRRGGWPLVGLVALIALVLCTALGPALLSDPWNPQVPVLVFLLFLLLAWSVGEGDLHMAPLLVATGTFVVQAHVGYVLLAAGIGALAGVLAWHTRRRDEAGAATGGGRSLLLAAGVAAVLWLPPVLQQLFGDDGNLGALLAHAADPGEPTAGWRTAFGVMGTELGLPGAWLAGGDDGPFGVPEGPVLPALGLLLAAGVLGWLAARRGAGAAGRLAIITIAAAALGVASTASVSGPVFDYVVQWWWVVAGFTWLSILWSTVSLLRDRHRQVAAAIALTVAAGLAVVLGGRAVPATVPEQEASDAVGQLGPQVVAGLSPGDTYRIEWIDGWGGTGMGFYFDLDRRGLDVFVPPEYQPAFESWRTADVRAVDATLLLVGGDDAGPGYEPPPGATRLAHHDPLTPAERARADELRATIDEELASQGQAAPASGEPASRDVLLAYAAVDEQLLTELAELESRGSAYSVYLLRPGG